MVVFCKPLLLKGNVRLLSGWIIMSENQKKYSDGVIRRSSTGGYEQLVALHQRMSRELATNTPYWKAAANVIPVGQHIELRSVQDRLVGYVSYFCVEERLWSYLMELFASELTGRLLTKAWVEITNSIREREDI